MFCFWFFSHDTQWGPWEQIEKNVGCFQNLNNCQTNALQLAKEKNTFGKLPPITLKICWSKSFTSVV